MNIRQLSSRAAGFDEELTRLLAFEEAADGKGRMLIGAFRSPSEAEQAAILLQREKISFQLVTR